jgi:hypothetical protein
MQYEYNSRVQMIPKETAMTLVIEITPELETQIRHAASKAGLSRTSLLSKV